MVSQIPGHGGLPGLSTRVDTKSRQILLGQAGLINAPSVIIHADTVDAGGTPTTELRPGLVLVRIETGAHKGKYCQYGHASAPASAATIKHAVILEHFLEMRDDTGTAVDKPAMALIGGLFDESKLIYVSADADVKAAMKAALKLCLIVPAVA